MKNTLLGLLTLALVGFIALTLVKGRPSSPYSFTAVEGSIKTIASSSGFRIAEHRRASVNPNLASLDRISTEVTGRPCFDDKDEYLLEKGSDVIRVMVDHSLGKAGSVKISPTSKQAEAFSAELHTAFPGLDCQIKGS